MQSIGCSHRQNPGVNHGVAGANLHVPSRRKLLILIEQNLAGHLDRWVKDSFDAYVNDAGEDNALHH